MNNLELPGLVAAFADASEGMLAAILDQSADCIKVIGENGTVDYMNRNGQCAMEVEDFCAIAGQPWTALWPAEAGPMILDAMAKARAGEAARFEAFCPTAKGTPRWWDVSVSPLRGPDGTGRGYIATSRDVTERVRSGALRDAVAEEIRHRLRNHYVVVASLLAAHARGRPDLEAFVREITGLLNALGVAQTMTAEGGAACRLATLVPALLDPYATPNCRIRIGALPHAELDQPLVDAFALVLGELAVNSTKHGALGARGEVTLEGALVAGRLTLTWQEQSDRPVTRHERDGGQGLRLMTRVLASRGGEIDVAWAPDGLTATFWVPFA
ncbi:MAG TPA: PAS domain-containing protein [Allosphingosinicella sp.]|nr:PAS domain-containing protein [Allosphingosinicella sp.]